MFRHDIIGRVTEMTFSIIHLCIPDRLTQILEAERDSPKEFQPLPFHYVEISRLLFDQ